MHGTSNNFVCFLFLVVPCKPCSSLIDLTQFILCSSFLPLFLLLLLLLFLFLLLRRRLLSTKLLVLDLAPVLRLGLVAVGGVDAAGEGGPAGVQLVAVARVLGGLEGLEGDGLVPAEALAHVDHAAPALAEPFLELLALGRQRLNQRRSQALGRRVPVDHDAFGFL